MLEALRRLAALDVRMVARDNARLAREALVKTTLAKLPVVGLPLVRGALS